MCAGIGGNVGDHPQRGLGRADIGTSAEVFLDDVVLDGALQLRDIRALLFGGSDIKRQKPRGGGVDRHRGVHLLERDLVEERPHIAEVADRHADLANLAARQTVIAVIAGLGRQIESHRKAGLPLGQIRTVELVRGFGGRMARIGAEKPGAIFLRVRHIRPPLGRASNFIARQPHYRKFSGGVNSLRCGIAGFTLARKPVTVCQCRKLLKCRSGF